MVRTCFQSQLYCRKDLMVMLKQGKRPETVCNANMYVQYGNRVRVVRHFVQNEHTVTSPDLSFQIPSFNSSV